MSKHRSDIVLDAFQKKPLRPVGPQRRPADEFGELVFNRAKMYKYLDRKTYDAIVDCIDNGAQLDLATADRVADGIKSWAMSLGVTHCCHWFQPLTDTTAEKHDAFMEYDLKGGMIEEFSGKSLVQQEPDASSFPNGGIRATFEARGYTAWDPTSPVFVLDDCLCIPTIFISYTGEALDYKAPLKKAIKAVSEAALPIARLFEPDVRKITVNLGWEQEYFLIDEELYAARPDLMACGRTLMGHASAKNQQMDDHYFGQIPERVREFMKELEHEAYRLGIPMKTRHNEVAPNQFEFAPIFGEMNLANDQNMLVMGLMRRVARKHGFTVLLHEKPFDGINGSGKHNNWSLSTDTGTNLFGPGREEMRNLEFLVFFVNTLRAVERHGALLKASIASATNAHRLGAHEAPPAVISAFLGRTMTAVLERLTSELPDDLTIAGKRAFNFGLSEIPELFIDNTDRNRTSPFAFTGNRFEFRAVGSSANSACAMIVLNTAVAEQLTDFYNLIRPRLEAGVSLHDASLDALRPLARSVLQTVCFDGNGYSDEWLEEAARRGLDTSRSVPEMFLEYTRPEAVRMFEQMHVMTASELEARNEVKLETYIKTIQIEARTLTDIAINQVIPPAVAYLNTLTENIWKVSQIFPDGGADSTAAQHDIAQTINRHIQTLHERVDRMTETRHRANRTPDIMERARLYHTVADQLVAIREPIDELETLVDDNLWTLPKYREMLWIR